MTTLPNKDLLRPDEVAYFFSVTRKTVYLWVEQEILDGVKVGGILRVTKDSVDRWLKKLDEKNA